MAQKKYKRHVIVAVKTVKEFLDLHPANGMSAASLAATAGISRTILHQAFKHEFGIELGEYKMQARMTHSKQLLLSGYSIKQVSIQLRYASNSAFTAAFKKFFGETPSDFLDGNGKAS